MNEERINKVLFSLERARAARKFAIQCGQRAAMLVTQANALMERFDELERTMLRRAALRRPAQTHKIKKPAGMSQRAAHQKDLILRDAGKRQCQKPVME